MSFTQLTWANGKAPALNAANLNRIEQGIADVHALASTGSGSPMSVVTPTAVGQLYTDTAATTGARVWVSTGTTDTSWTVASGDTGTREITTSLINGWTGNLFIQRVDRIVSLWSGGSNGLDGRAFTSDHFLLWSSIVGLRPPTTTSYGLGLVQNFGRTFVSNISSAIGTQDLYIGGALKDRYNVRSVWITDDAWPTTLPGSAV